MLLIVYLIQIGLGLRVKAGVESFRYAFDFDDADILRQEPVQIALYLRLIDFLFDLEIRYLKISVYARVGAAAACDLNAPLQHLRQHMLDFTLYSAIRIAQPLPAFVPPAVVLNDKLIVIHAAPLYDYHVLYQLTI